MKEKISKCLKENGRTAILVLFLLELIISIFITPNQYDDDFFIGKATGNILNFVQSRYYDWTSRVIIEYVLCLVLKISKYLWILLEAFMVAVIGYSISRVFINDNKNENNYMLICMILIYPLNVMASAGWAATTINYMWPLAMCLYSLIPIKKMWDKEKIKPYEYILYTVSILFAGNQEQTCAILVGTYIVFTILMIIKDKKIHPYMIIQDILIIASLIFILTCPGNYVRNNLEMVSNFKDIATLNILDKISLGLTSTIGILVGKGNLVYTLFTFLIMVFIFLNYKENLYRVVALIPFISAILFKYLMYVSYLAFPYLGSLQELLLEEKVMLTAITSNNLTYAIPLILAFANIICVTLSLLIIFKNLKNNVSLLIFFVGLASRLIIGFSPTIWSSKERTMIFFEFAMIIISILIWQELVKKNDKTDKKSIKRVGFAIKLAGILQYINVFLCVMFTQK